MPINPETAGIVSRLNAATNAIAARLQKFIDNEGNLSTEGRAAVEAEIARLEAMGSNPSDPVPA